MPPKVEPNELSLGKGWEHLFLNPACLLPAVWAIYLLFFFVAPLHYPQPISTATWIFILGSVVTFTSAAFLAHRTSRRSWNKVAQPPLPVEVSPRLDHAITLCAALGLGGAICMAIDKVFFSGLDYSAGIGAVRMQRATDVLKGVDIHRTPLIYLGWLTISFANVAHLLYLLHAETVSRKARLWAQAALMAPLVFSILYGGRFPLFLVIALAVATSVVRGARGRSIVPREWMGCVAFLIFVAVTLSYSVLTLNGRLSHLKTQTVENYQEFYSSRDVVVAPYLQKLGQPSAIESASATTPSAPVTTPSALATTPSPKNRNYAALIGHLLQPIWYIVLPLPHLDLAIQHRQQLSLAYGQFQVPLISTLAGVTAPSLDVRPRMLKEHQAAGFYGVYLTAWGGWLIDAGLVGALFGIGATGWLSGKVHAMFRQRRTPLGDMLLVYVSVSVVLTPLMALYTVANGLLILFSILVTGFYLAHRTET